MRINMQQKYAIVGNAEPRSFRYTIIATCDNLPSKRCLAQYARKWYAVRVKAIQTDVFGDRCVTETIDAYDWDDLHKAGIA